MKRWQKWLSYIYEIEVETVDSDINGLLSLYISEGEYQLCTSDAIYSWGLKYYNFLETFKQVSLPSNNSNVLVLGMGMGSIPLILEKKFNKQYNYTAVEIDESVIYLASEYSLPELNAPIDILGTDAAFFVNTCEEKYDMICVDIFQSSKIPSRFNTKEFLLSTKELLNDNGQIIVNRLYYFDEDKPESEAYYNEIFKEVFPNSQAIKAHKNLMLCGIK